MSMFDFAVLDGLSPAQQVELLKAQVTQLEARNAIRQVIQFRGLDFTVREYPLVLGLLYGQGSLRRETAWAALYAGNPEAKEPLQTDILNIFMRRVRAKLQPYGVRILTVYGDGWKMPPESFAKFEELVVPVTIEGLAAEAYHVPGGTSLQFPAEVVKLDPGKSG